MDGPSHFLIRFSGENEKVATYIGVPVDGSILERAQLTVRTYVALRIGIDECLRRV